MEATPQSRAAEIGRDPPKPSVVTGIVGSALWLLLIWGVYVKLPHLDEVFRDFGVPVPRVSAVVLANAGSALPVIGLGCALLLGFSRPRRASSIALVWVPLTLLLALSFAVGLPYLALVQSLT